MPTSRPALRDAHPAVRVASAVALGTIGDPAADPGAPAGDEGRVLRQREVLDEGRHRQAPFGRRRWRRGGRGLCCGHATRGSRRRSTWCSSARCATTTGQRADLDTVMRSTARAKAGSIKGAVMLDSPTRRCSSGLRTKIPVLLVDGNLSRLTQTTARDGGVIISAQVDFSIRRVPADAARHGERQRVRERRRSQREQGRRGAPEPRRQRCCRERDVERQARRSPRSRGRDAGKADVEGDVEVLHDHRLRHALLREGQRVRPLVPGHAVLPHLLRAAHPDRHAPVLEEHGDGSYKGIKTRLQLQVDARRVHAHLGSDRVHRSRDASASARSTRSR